MESGHKLLLPFPEEPVVRVAARAALSSGLGAVAVVVDPREPAVAEALADLDVARLENPEAASGIASSIRRAGEWGLARAEALVLLLADEPGVDPAIVAALGRRWAALRPLAARVRYADRPGHPVVVTRAFLERASPPGGDRGLGARLGPPSAADLAVEVEAPTDIDTRADYEAALARLAH